MRSALDDLGVAAPESRVVTTPSVAGMSIEQDLANTQRELAEALEEVQSMQDEQLARAGIGARDAASTLLSKSINIVGLDKELADRNDFDLAVEILRNWAEEVGMLRPGGKPRSVE